MYLQDANPYLGSSFRTVLRKIEVFPLQTQLSVCTLLSLLLKTVAFKLLPSKFIQVSADLAIEI